MLQSIFPKVFLDKLIISLLSFLLGVSDEALEEECIYLSGNSLGLRPKKAEHYMNLVMDQWRDEYVNLNVN